MDCIRARELGRIFAFGVKSQGKEDTNMISYQKPTISALEAASAAIQGQNKQSQIAPDGVPRPSSGLAYDLDE
jgi:hypothetical protein